MLIRFLKGESFHDRPLTTFSSWHLQDDPTDKYYLVTATTKEPMINQLGISKVLTTETVLLAGGSNALLSQATMMSAVSIAIVLLLVITAFVLGIRVGRKSKEPGVNSNMYRAERTLLKMNGNYVSM